jgi:hypothetical protein
MAFQAEDIWKANAFDNPRELGMQGVVFLMSMQH